MTVGHHLPSAAPRSHEAIWGGGCGIAKDFWVMDRINSFQAARYHKPALAAAVAAITRSRRSHAENAQGGGDCKSDESLLSTHGGFLLFVCGGDCAASCARAAENSAALLCRNHTPVRDPAWFL
jgi:hypothetical protein